jgi:transposase-like protein
MSINGNGIRDTARVLKINKNTVISTLKKVEQHRPSKSKFQTLNSAANLAVKLELACD